MITSQELAFVRLAMRRRLVTANLVREAVERKKWDDPDRPLSSILVDMGALGDDDAERLRKALAAGDRGDVDRRPHATMVVDPHEPQHPTDEADGAPPEHVGPYKLIRLLGAGAMGAVYMAEHLELRRQVALKLLMSDGAPSPRAIARFRREARLAARLDHPNIVRVYEAGFEEGQHFIAMDMVAGRSVAELIALNEVSPRRAVHLARKSAEATHYAHEQGVIHRDLKPANILVDERSGEPRVTDFGLATMSEPEEDDRLTRTGAAVGTPAYMAPEQVRGQLDKIDARTDVYALGATLYEMLTGRPPFEAETFLDLAKKICEREPEAPRRRNSRIPPDVETICLKALEKSQKDRYQDAAEMAADLAAYLDDAPIVAQRPSTFTVARRWARRRPAVVATMFALAGTLCGSLTWHFTRPGVLNLQSSPPGATVLVDGREVGMTRQGAPLQLELKAGNHKLRFRLEGHLERALGAESVQIGHGEITNLTGTLISTQGVLRVVSQPPGARVSIHDEAGNELEQGRTDFLASLQAGDYRIVVLQPPPGFLSTRSEFMTRVEPGGRPLEVPLELVADKGVLHLESTPDEATYRGGRGETGVTPDDLPGAGRHRVELSRAGYLTRVLVTEVPGKPVRERVTLAPAVLFRRSLEGRLRAAPLVQDLDGDGTLDLVALEQTSDGSWLLIVFGAGRRDPIREPCEATTLVKAVDLDQDGVLDLVLGTRDRLELRDGATGRLLMPPAAINAHGVVVDAEAGELLFVDPRGKLQNVRYGELARLDAEVNSSVSQPPVVFELDADDRTAAFPLSDGTLRIQVVGRGAPRDLPVTKLRWRSRVQTVVVSGSRHPWVLALASAGPALVIDPQAGTVHEAGDDDSRFVHALAVQAGARSWLLLSDAQAGCHVFLLDTDGVRPTPKILPRRPIELAPGELWTPSGEVFRLERDEWTPVAERSTRTEALIDPSAPSVAGDIDGDGIPELVAATPDRRALAVLATSGEWLRWRGTLSAPPAGLVSHRPAGGGKVLLGNGSRVESLDLRDGQHRLELELASDVLDLTSLGGPEGPTRIAVACRDDRLRCFQRDAKEWRLAWETERASASVVSVSEDVDGDGLPELLVAAPMALIGSKDGATIWAQDDATADVSLRTPLALGGERAICVGAGGTKQEPIVLARTPQGEELWRSPLPLTRTPRHVFGADELGVVIAATDSPSSIPYRHELAAFERRDGSEVWRQEKLVGEATSIRGLAVGGDEPRLVLTLKSSPRDHELVCVDVSNGQVLWAHVLPRPARRSPAPSSPLLIPGQPGRRADDRIAVVAPTGAILSFALDDGRLLGERRLDDDFVSWLSPLADDGVIAATSQGVLLGMSYPPPSPATPTRRERIREQIRRLGSGRVQLAREALNELSALQAKRPRDPSATLALAWAYLGQERWKEARETADQARKLLARGLPTRVADCLSIQIQARLAQREQPAAVAPALNELAALDPLRAAKTTLVLFHRLSRADREELAGELLKSATRFLRAAVERDPEDGEARGLLGQLLLDSDRFDLLDWRSPEPTAFVRGRNQISAARVELLLALPNSPSDRLRAAAIVALALERKLTTLFKQAARTAAHDEAEKNQLATLDRQLTTLLAGASQRGGLLSLAAEVGQAALNDQPLPRSALRSLAEAEQGWRPALEALLRSSGDGD